MDNTAFRIRALEPSDYADWAAIYNCPLVQRNTASLPFGSLEAARKRLESRGDSFYSLVAEVDGHVVGQVGLDTARGRRSHVGVLGIMVHDDYTRRGIGGALLTAMLELADNWLNLHRLELQVYTDNEVAISFYHHFGFEVEGTLRDYAYGEGHYMDVHLMARLRARP